MTARSEIMVQRIFFQIALWTLITAVVWVGMGIYQATRGETQSEVDKSLLSPLNPQVDLEVIEKLNARINQESIAIEQESNEPIE